MTGRARGLAILNPIAGADPRRVSALAGHCRELVGDLDIATTDRAGEAIDLVASALAEPRPPEVIVAVGGDGTVREAAEGLARGLGRWPSGRGAGEDDEGLPALLVLPGGSGNSIYRALWSDTDWRQAVETALDGGRNVRSLDLIRLVEADRAAFLGVNVGLIAAIAEYIERTKRERRDGDEGEDDEAESRYWAAFGEVLQSFSSPSIRVVVDGELLHEGGVSLCTIGGVRRFGRGSFEVLPRSLLDDGLLDVCAVQDVAQERLVALAALVPDGRHVHEPEVAYAQGRSISIERLDGHDLAIEHDGDPYRATQSLTLDVVEAAVPALVGWRGPQNPLSRAV
ncbi:MAG TPA: diacylglycerol kinase family protein [Thermoleophilaceae bacterium]|jgi:diacylglycerol kinase (ATP)